MCESKRLKPLADDEKVIAGAAVPDREIRGLLANMPSAHDVCIVHPSVGSGSPSLHGRSWRHRMNDPARRARRANRVVRHIRFVYFANVDDDNLFADYHHELATAEVLMDRVLAAHAAGMTAVHSTLTGQAEEQLVGRPPRGSFSQVTPEYIRWYGRDGIRRDVPMVREDLAIELMDEYVATYSDALAIAVNDSGALSREDQSWLIKRASAPVCRRPLHATEFSQLVRAIEAACRVPHGDSVVAQANIDIARRAAAVLGAVVDELIQAPFQTPMLAQAFAEFHQTHRRRAAEAWRVAGFLPLPAHGVLGWFSTKRARID